MPPSGDKASMNRSLLLRAAVLAGALALSHLPAWAAPAAPGEAAAPCCGPVTAQGRELLRVLDASNVRHRWLPRTSIDWSSGEAAPRDAAHPKLASHCSAFAAAMSSRLGVPLLRPPSHGQRLLANAQARWLAGVGVGREGWREVDARQAQALANRGWLVLASYASPNPRRAGHIAVIRPATPTLGQLLARGPHETQAGASNLLDATVARGFSQHPGAWKPGGGAGLHFYAHAVDWGRASH